MEDFYFNESDLVDGSLFIAGVEPGDFVVIDGNGELCFPDMQAVTNDGVKGTSVHFRSNFDHGSDYRIKYIAN